VKHTPKPEPANPSGNKRLVIIIALVAAGGLAFLMSRSKDGSGSDVDTKRSGNIKGVFAGGVTKTKVNAKPAETRGAFAADEALQIIGNAGAVSIVWEVPDPKLPVTPDMERFFGMIGTEVDAFKKRLKDKGRFTFGGELKLPRPDGANRTAWPAGELSKFLERTPPTATIVAFCLLPANLSEAEKAALRSRPGKLIIVAGSTPDMKPYIDQKLAHLAVTSKMPVPPPTGTEPETPIQWVMHVHDVLKPQASP